MIGSALGGAILMVRRSLRQHALSTLVTVLATALASGLVMSVFSIKEQTYRAFAGGSGGFDAVLGARGSQLQLVLNTVFHLETSPGNIPWKTYQALKNDGRIAKAVPLAMGDNYRGFRIVGATPDLFDHFEFAEGEAAGVQSGGRLFDPARREAVVGSFAAQRTQLKVGDTINPYHGLVFDEGARHEEEYVVVGIFEPTNSPSDRVIFIPIEGIFRMGGHVLRGTGEVYNPETGTAIPDEHKEVSAVMLKFKNAQVGFNLDQQINKQGKEYTLAWPIGTVMADFLEKMGWVNQVLALVAYLTMIVAAASILASIYNTLNERRREFAILRALGARRRLVFTAIVLESSAIAAMGALAGYLVCFGIMAGVAFVVRRQTGVALDIFLVGPVFLFTPLAMIALGALAGIVPAVKAYATDVASNLVPQS